MTLEQIQATIPHRPPMLLVDEIVRQDENQIMARKTFRADEFFFQGHYPHYPIVPGVILCEAAMQAGAVLVAQYLPEARNQVPVATRLSDVKFRAMVRPNDQIQIDVRLVERLANAFYLEAKVTCDGKLAVRFQFACTVATVR